MNWEPPCAASSWLLGSHRRTCMPGQRAVLCGCPGLFLCVFGGLAATGGTGHDGPQWDHKLGPVAGFKCSRDAVSLGHLDPDPHRGRILHSPPQAGGCYTLRAHPARCVAGKRKKCRRPNWPPAFSGEEETRPDLGHDDLQVDVAEVTLAPPQGPDRLEAAGVPWRSHGNGESNRITDAYTIGQII